MGGVYDLQLSTCLLFVDLLAGCRQTDLHRDAAGALPTYRHVNDMTRSSSLHPERD